jgi:CBS domain containing-hemolysin-like protein
LDGLGWLVIACLALALGSVLSALAQSLRNLSRTALEEVAAIRNSPGATARVRAILSDLEGHASAVALPRVVCNLLVAVSLIMFVAFARDPFQASSRPRFFSGALESPSRPQLPTTLPRSPSMPGRRSCG